MIPHGLFTALRWDPDSRYRLRVDAGKPGPFHDAFRINAGEFVGDRLPQWKHPIR
jgi:hypothetical protein